MVKFNRKGELVLEPQPPRTSNGYFTVASTNKMILYDWKRKKELEKKKPMDPYKWEIQFGYRYK